MKKNKVLISLFALSLWTAGCQKTGVGMQIATDGNQSANSISCKTETGYVDPSLLQIEGNSVAQAGAPVTYHLNQDLGCSSVQKVTWKTLGAGAPLQAGPTLKSTFPNAGAYTVIAQVESYDPSSSGLSQKSTLSLSTKSFSTVVVKDKPVISAPALGMVGNNISFSLAVPEGMSLVSASWSFGDGLPGENKLGFVTHMYGRPGEYDVTAVVMDSNNTQYNLTHHIQILMIQDGLECVSNLSISGATEAVVGTPVGLSLNIPPCLLPRVTAVKWNFGDGGTSGNQSVQHTYQAAGNYQASVQIFLDGSTEAWVTLTHDIAVSPAPPAPTPTPTPVATPEPTPEPTPVNPYACPRTGEQRTSQSDLYSETVACGLNGTKMMSYRDVITEECQLVGESLQWKEISKIKQLQSEGACQGQSCRLPDGSVLANGDSRTYYSAQNPAASCSSVSQVRTCNNGVLGGSAEYNNLVCHEGCGDFGSHGTTKTNVITGEISVPMTCAFGEQGYFSIYNQVSDQVCTDGKIVNSNTRQGSVKTPGSCPTYSYVATDKWSTCSADCGGKQTRIYTCKDNNGADAPAERCTGSAPVEERVCDGNPEAARRQEQSVTQETANSSEKCPANQIGVVSKIRDVTKTTTYACLNHQVQKEGEQVTYGAWTVEKYCRDYVAYRCSQDSLDNTQALGRYQWMVKCQDQIPVVKEFLEKFDDLGVKIKNKQVTIDAKKGQVLYPTFMNYATKPEKPWIAPTSASASCTIPSTVYIATVCVSSCATPEQQILASEQLKGAPKYVSFIDALTQKYAYVTTLKDNGSMNSKSIEKTQVDQWVTELIDGNHDIIVFTMQSGRTLKVTPNHPIVSSEGLMKLASDFKVGDSLVVLGGELDPIVSLEHINHYGKVYNLFVKSSDIKKNIVVTNGYLNGTAFFQNQGAENINRQMFKDKMIKGVFSK